MTNARVVGRLSSVAGDVGDGRALAGGRGGVLGVPAVAELLPSPSYSAPALASVMPFFLLMGPASAHALVVPLGWRPLHTCVPEVPGGDPWLR